MRWRRVLKLSAGVRMRVFSGLIARAHVGERGEIRAR